MAEKDWIDLGVNKRYRDPQVQFKDKILVPLQQEATKKHLPYDFKGAWQDYKKGTDGLKSLFDETENETVRMELLRQIASFDDKFDVKKYGSTARFKKLGLAEAWERNRRTGAQEHVGYHVDFMVKDTGSNYSVFIPLNEWDAWSEAHSGFGVDKKGDK